MRSILLTGAEGGVGRATLSKLVEANYVVYAGAVDDWALDQLNSLKAELSTDQIIPVLLDIREKDQIDVVISRIESVHPDFAGLIANGAACPIGAPFELTDFESFEDVIATNVTGNARLIYRALHLLKENKGRIIIVGSLHGLVPLGLGGPYTLSKHANEALCATLRRELGLCYGIKVSIINPGGIKGTYMVARAFHEARQFAADVNECKPEEVHPANLDKGGHTSLVMPKIKRDPKYLPMYEQFAKSVHDVYVPGKLTMLSDPEENAAAIMKALHAPKPKVRYVTGWDAKIFYFLHRILPATWIDKIIIKAFYPMKGEHIHS